MFNLLSCCMWILQCTFQPPCQHSVLGCVLKSRGRGRLSLGDSQLSTRNTHKGMLPLLLLLFMHCLHRCPSAVCT